MRVATRAGAGALALALAACAGLGRVAPETPRPLTGIDAQRLSEAPGPRPPEDILALTDDMRRFVARNVSRHVDVERRIRQLTSAVLHPGTLGIAYHDRMTRTAAETFETANGNCLSLSILFVALAREAGIEARFYEVNMVPEWTLAGDVVFATRHVNVGGRITAGTTYVMDFSPYVARREVGRQRLTDEEAIAQYYNNIGANYLAQGSIVAAYRHFVAGIEMAPRISFLWSNLSVVYSRNGQADAAEWALRRAVAIDGRNTSAMSNLARVLRERGATEEAEALAAKIDGAQRDNPYYQFALGERHLAESEFSDALKRLQRAISLEPGEPLFYRKAAMAAMALNDTALAEDYDGRAEQLDAEAQRRGRNAFRRR
ncbi:MAG: tetratricopeptide repeat protein [Pseudomonadota bacterium]